MANSGPARTGRSNPNRRRARFGDSHAPMVHDKKALKEKAAEELRLLLLISAYLALFFVAFLTYRRLISRSSAAAISGTATR